MEVRPSSSKSFLISGVAKSGMCPGWVLRSMSVGMRLSGWLPPTSLSRPKGSLASPSFLSDAKVLTEERAGILRLTTVAVVLFLVFENQTVRFDFRLGRFLVQLKVLSA